jgi:hypothetical protein
VLADLESRDQRYLWGPNDEGRFGMRRPAGGGGGRVLRLIAPAGTAYPGVDLRGFPADWSAHAALEGRVRLVEGPGDSAAFVVRLDDWHGHREGAWASRRLHAARAWRTFRLPLADLGPHPDGRPPDLRDVFSLVIYVPHPARRTVLELDDLRLR